MDETLANPWQEPPPRPITAEPERRERKKERKKGRRGGGGASVSIKCLWDAAASEPARS